MGQVNVRRRFSTTHSSKKPQLIFMKLEIFNYLPDTITHAKLQGDTCTLTWVSGQRASFYLYHATRVASLDTHNTSLYVVPAKEVHFWG